MSAETSRRLLRALLGAVAVAAAAAAAAGGNFTDEAARRGYRSERHTVATAGGNFTDEAARRGYRSERHTVATAGGNFTDEAARRGYRSERHTVATAGGNFTDEAARRGYRSERHTVATADGYLLTLFRIRRGRGCARRSPVFLLNGLLLSAESWLDAGPGAGLGYLLPDACHDTWVGSVRGERHARRHLRLDPRAPAFWRFSADEMAAHDVPAALDYVLARTGEARLNYVGFSQGGTLALMLLAERPEYARKLGVLVAVAPPTTGAGSSGFNRLLLAAAKLEPALAALGVYEVLSTGSAFQRLAERICKFRVLREKVCGRLLAALDAPHPGSVADATLATLFAHMPAGTSVRTLARYGQLVASGRFRKYDFGERENLKRYGSAQPPAYEPGAVAAPVLLLQGRGDAMVPLAGTRRLARRLPRLLELFVVDDPAWNHFDSVYSRYINRSIFPKINQYLLKYS